MKKILLYTLIMLFMFSFVFATTNQYQQYTSQLPWKYEIYETTDNTYLTLTSTPNNPNSYIYSNTGKIEYEIKPSTYGLFIRYPAYTEDYTLKKGGVDLLWTGSILNSYDSNFTKYRQSGSSYYELQAGKVCQAQSYSGFFNTNVFTLSTKSTLWPVKTTSGAHINNVDTVIPHLLDKYYYMKAFVFLKLTTRDSPIYNEIYVLPNPTALEKDGSGKIKLYSYNNSINTKVKELFKDQIDDIDTLFDDYIYFNDKIFNANDGGTGNEYLSNYIITNPLIFNTTGIPDLSIKEMKYVPYTLLKPTNVDINFDLRNLKTQLEAKGINAKYKIEYIIIPIDGKCDLNDNNNLEVSEYNPIIQEHLTNTFNVGTPPTIPEVNIIGNIQEYNDAYDKEKIVYNTATTEMLYIDKNSVQHSITLPQRNETKKIKIVRNGANVRNDTISPAVIALRAHKLKKIKDALEAQNYVNSSYRLMTNLNITKEIDTISNPGKTKITIKLDIPSTYKNNLTVYSVIPESIIDKIDTTNFNIINSSGQFFITEKDPVIGWYFNNSNSTEEIEYELPGASEGGTIIITQEPILFNAGNLIVNYRDTGCDTSFEAELFKLDDLSDSSLYKSGTKPYTVCLSSLYGPLTGGTSGLSKHIFNYTDGSNMSITLPMNIPVDVSIATINPIYWDMKIQKDNPTGDYSCIGSFNNDSDTSTFGDCAYTDNRIWLYLGVDNQPPTTQLNMPYLAHTVRIYFTATDPSPGIGVNKTYYCIQSSSDNCSNTATFKTYTDSFLLTCENDWGCTKTVKFYSTDKAGNKEAVKTEELDLIDSGSACQADCTAKPRPNRFLKDCNNLNGCTYYKYNNLGIFDDGAYVAEQCNQRTIGAWTTYNSTHEIQCPNGPFRKSRFTFERLFYKNSYCYDIQVMPYTAIIEGEMVKMNIIFCKGGE